MNPQLHSHSIGMTRLTFDFLKKKKKFGVVTYFCLFFKEKQNKKENHKFDPLNGLKNEFESRS